MSGIPRFVSNVLLPIIFLLLVLASVVAYLWLLRRRRQASHSSLLPQQLDDEDIQKRATHRRRTAFHIHSTLLRDHIELDRMHQTNLAHITNKGPAPSRPPEIRITRPDEVSENGKSKSIRVVTARLRDNNDNGVEPVHDGPPL